MEMKRQTVKSFGFILIFITLNCFLVLNAQNFRPYSELGFFGGGSYYLGELNPGRQFKFTQPAFGLVFKHNYNRRLAMRFNGLYGTLYADDAESTDEFQIRRNLMFRSRVLEFSGMLEFNFFEYEIGNPSLPATPFIFVGLNVFRFNPQAELNGEWYDLQPLGTEGQGLPDFPGRKPYSLISVGIPFGVGAKFHVGNFLSIALEWGLRKTFVDYIDDVSTTYVNPALLAAANGPESALLADRSLVEPGLTNVGRQRGNSQNNDWFSFAGITLTFKLQSKAPECAAYK